MKIIIALFILFSLTACKDWGTEGGNPEVHHGSSPAVGGYYLSTVICEKRKSCSGDADLNCQTQIETHPEITRELRMDSSYPTLKDLMTHSDDVVISSTDANSCFKAITELDCNSTLAQEAFNPTTYEDIHLSLRASGSCGEIFKPKN